MKQHLVDSATHLRGNDRGMTTAEYAVGTCAAVGVGGILMKILTSDEMRNALWSVVSGALSMFFGG